MVMSGRWRVGIAVLCGLANLTLLLLWLHIPNEASPEYIYTVEKLFQWVFLPVVVLGLWAAGVHRRCADMFQHKPPSFYKVFKYSFYGALCLLVLPLWSPSAAQASWQLGYMLSVCWSLGALCLSIAVFLLAAACKHNMASSLCCLVASLILAFACLEAWMLGSANRSDGLVDDTAHSRYVQTGQAERYYHNVFMPYGTFPAAQGEPYSVAHRTLKFDRILFDVRYGFDALGHRVTPLSTQSPQAEILVFGCSFSFGYGLEDEETWPWLLGKALGPAWRITNYAFSGFGAQQMLALLEEGVVPKPESNVKTAFFLALHHHVGRNDGVISFRAVSRRYALNEQGQLYTAGWSKDRYSTLYTLPQFFNGSQLVQHCCSLLQGAIVKQSMDTFLATYVAMLEKSSHLLKEKYGIPLTILLWPDIEYIAPALQERDIAFLKIRDMLPLWDESDGAVYYIDPQYELHPNARATREIAASLARHCKPMLP